MEEKLMAISLDTAENVDAAETPAEESSEPTITTTSYSFSKSSHTESVNTDTSTDFSFSFQDFLHGFRYNPSFPSLNLPANSDATTTTTTQSNENSTTTSTSSSHTDEHTTSTYTSTSTVSHESRPIEGYSNFDFKYNMSNGVIKSLLGMDLQTLIGDKINEVYNNIIRTITNNDVTYTSNTFYNVGNGNGYINDFDNKNSVLNFVNPNVASLARKDNQVDFNMADGTKFQAHVTNSPEDLFQYSFDGINISYAKLGFANRDNGFTYADGITFFGSSDNEDTVFFATPGINIDLNDSNFINIDNIDARNAENISDFTRQLIGNAGNNKIFASQGDELWGGKGDDELFGGSGNNIFRYGASDGNDVIRDSLSDDKVNLYNISIDDIAGVTYDDNQLRINLTDGGSLNIVGENGASNFILSDKSAWKYNRADNSITPAQTEQASVE